MFGLRGKKEGRKKITEINEWEKKEIYGNY
jgi:hypothetical protein